MTFEKEREAALLLFLDANLESILEYLFNPLCQVSGAKIECPNDNLNALCFCSCFKIRQNAFKSQTYVAFQMKFCCCFYLFFYLNPRLLSAKIEVELCGLVSVFREA